MHQPTIYAIYWLPPGATTSATYQTIIDQFLGRVGGTSFFNILTQYPDTCCAPQNAASFGGAWVDTRAYTRAGTTADPLLDSDIRDEIAHAISSNPGWAPPGPETMYFVFTGKDVQSCFDASGTSCFRIQYCAYHSYFTDFSADVIYGYIPYAASTPVCTVPNSPNGDNDADSAINLISHELFESITDWGVNVSPAWQDSSGLSGEVADKCAWQFGPAGADGGDVTLNGTPYYVQMEWSNADGGCTLGQLDSGAISGTVTDAGATPIAGATVTACPNGGGACRSATSAGDGTYTITGLAAGSYIVFASTSNCALSPPCASYPTQYYNGTYNYYAATPVGVTDGTTTGINFALELAGTITGTVTDANHVPIAGANVSATATTCCGLGSATTAADGTYTIGGLAPGSYLVYASGASCSASSPPCVTYAGQYYDGTYNSSDATPINVTSAGSTSGINFALELAGSITGTVTDANHVPIAGANVYASTPSCCGYGSATTAADGTYTMTGLPPGSYIVQAWSLSCSTDWPSSPPCATYPSQYYNGTYDFNSATPVAVSAGATAIAINFALQPGGSISGVVTDVNSVPIAGAYVSASTQACCGYGSATTAADGTYTITGLAPGSYIVYASGAICSTSSPPCAAYAGQYYDGTYNSTDATPVSVTPAGSAPGINFALELAGSITGTVTDANSVPIAGVSVAVSRQTCCGYGSAITAADGTYTITGLAPGSYIAQAFSGGYVTTYYDGKVNYYQADSIGVSAGQATPGINFALGLAGTISGTVTDASAQPISGAWVVASGTTCCGWGYATTAADGTYTMTGLPSGSYTVWAAEGSCPPSPPGGTCDVSGSQFYVGSYELTGATAVAVAPSATTAGIDFALQLGQPATDDVDGDGCADGRELTMIPLLNPVDAWDFYSVPIPALFSAPHPLTVTKDHTVAASDAQAVFAYFKVGAKIGTTVYDQDLNENGVEDGVEYDRTVVGRAQSGPPDGVIAPSDAQVAFAQFELGYKC